MIPLWRSPLDDIVWRHPALRQRGTDDKIGKEEYAILISVIKNVDCMCRVYVEARLYLAKVWFQAWIRSNEANSTQHMFQSGNQLASSDLTQSVLASLIVFRFQGPGYQKKWESCAFRWDKKWYTLVHTPNERKNEKFFITAGRESCQIGALDPISKNLLQSIIFWTTLNGLARIITLCCNSK